MFPKFFNKEDEVAIMNKKETDMNQCSASSPNDCQSSVSFQNLLTVPVTFCPHQWDDVRISVKPCLYCVAEPYYQTTEVTIQDPCGALHKVITTVNLKKRRIVGGIYYNLAIDFTNSDVQGSKASAANYYFISVDQVYDYLDESQEAKTSVSVSTQSLTINQELQYGNDYAVKIDGVFKLTVS